MHVNLVKSRYTNVKQTIKLTVMENPTNLLLRIQFMKEIYMNLFF